MSNVKIVINILNDKPVVEIFDIDGNLLGNAQFRQGSIQRAAEWALRDGKARVKAYIDLLKETYDLMKNMNLITQTSELDNLFKDM